MTVCLTKLPGATGAGARKNNNMFLLLVLKRRKWKIKRYDSCLLYSHRVGNSTRHRGTQLKATEGCECTLITPFSQTLFEIDVTCSSNPSHSSFSNPPSHFWDERGGEEQDRKQNIVLPFQDVGLPRINPLFPSIEQLSFPLCVTLVLLIHLRCDFLLLNLFVEMTSAA